MARTFKLTLIALFLCSSALIANAETQLVPFSPNTRFISLRSSSLQLENQSYVFEINKSGMDILKVFPLIRPGRIVVDLRSANDLKASDIAVLSNPLVKKIRLSKFEGHYRCVLDLYSEKIPTFSWLQTKEQFRMLIKPGNLQLVRKIDPASGNERARLNPESISERRPVNNVAVNSPSKYSGMGRPGLNSKVPIQYAQLESSNKNLTIEKQPVLEQKVSAAKMVTIPSVRKFSQILTSLQFIELLDGQKVRLEFSKLPQYTFSKSSAKEYTLKISQAGIEDKKLLLPQFPPQNFEGITMVAAEQGAEAITIYFSTETGIRLSILRTNNTLDIQLKKS